MRHNSQAHPEKNLWQEAAVGALQPETVRHNTIGLICALLMWAPAMAMPVALGALLYGYFIPLGVVLVVFALGFTASHFQKKEAADDAADILIAGMMLIGTILTLIAPGLADFGLATALLGPVMASLLGNRRTERLAWILAVAAVSASAFPGDAVARLLVGQGEGTLWAAAASYGIFATAVALSAHRLGVSVEGFEKAQIDAFRHLVENIQSSVVRLSHQGEMLFVSKSSEDLFGCKRYELAGSGLLDRMHLQDRPAYMTAYAAANQDGIPSTVEVRMRKDADPRGEEASAFIWVEIGISPVLGGTRKEGRYEVILLMRDISQRKRQEKEIILAQKAAQEASEAKSHFLAAIGHELRTPLNAIVGFSEMMTAEIVGKLDDKQREYAQLINKSGLHLLDIVNMLMDMSKIEAGKFELQLEEFSSSELIGPCLQMVKPMAVERSISLVVDAAIDLPEVRGDERAYRQIIINLLSNAVKFSNTGGEVRLGIKRQGTDLNISVSDDGIGMTHDVVERVGEPFFQAHQGHNRRFEGTGLGLSIVKGLVALHGGRLHVNSEPGKGTVMTILMPIKGPSTKPAQFEVVTKLTPKQAQAPATPNPERKSATR